MGIRLPAAWMLFAALAGPRQDGPASDFRRYVDSARRFADACLDHGRDTYGAGKSPLFVDVLHAETMQPPPWKGPKGEWILSNFASQQPLMRLLEGLTALTGERKYREAAEEAARFVLARGRSPSGLIYWGGHAAWDLRGDAFCGEYDGSVHELKTHQPYYELMWRADPAAARSAMESIWAAHVVDWKRLDYNRHGSTRKPAAAGWDGPFDTDIEVPFPSAGGNLSFVNAGISILRAGTLLAVLGKDPRALEWTRRFVWRWQQARDPKTGLSGGQLSYRKQDRAQEALGHVHPDINEAKMVASYHSYGRYRDLPLAQMQAGEILVAAGGPFARVGKEFIQWAADDLKVYARHCLDPESGRFVAVMTDGTRIRGEKSKEGYYNAGSFASIGANGTNLWGYATAWRLTRDPDLWERVRQIAKGLGLGDPGGSLRQETGSADGAVIYALLELHEALRDPALLKLACRVGNNILKRQAPSGLFPSGRRGFARTGDELPLAVLHLASAITGRRSRLPSAALDSRFFHCRYHGDLDEGQKKRGDERTYDNNVYFGR